MLKRYIKEHKLYIITFFGCVIIFAVTFLLYGLPIAAVLYPAVLCGVFSLLVGLVGLNAANRKHAMLTDAEKRGIYLDSESLPADKVVEEDYKRIVELLLKEQADNSGKMMAQYQELSRYYTLWAHQIKTPIASMRLKLSGEDSSLSREIMSDLVRIEQYVDMVMTYVRLGSDSTDYTFRDCSLDALVRSSVKKFSSDFIRKKLSFEFEPKGISVLTDEKWIGFVLEQLLSNALKYTQKGSIRMETGYADSSVINGSVINGAEAAGAAGTGAESESQTSGSQVAVLSISDTGIGISPENLPRIFEIGFTGLNGRMENNRASGIGLYLVKRICDNLKIEIRVESVVGEGTCIKLFFSDKKVSVLQD